MWMRKMFDPSSSSVPGNQKIEIRREDRTPAYAARARSRCTPSSFSCTLRAKISSQENLAMANSGIQRPSGGPCFSRYLAILLVNALSLFLSSPPLCGQSKGSATDELHKLNESARDSWWTQTDTS